MKIILSPSKTADYTSSSALASTELRYPAKTKKIVSTIRKLSQKDLGKALHIKGDILKQTYNYYQNYYKSPRYQAFPSFNGLVFKQLQKDLYREEEYRYIEEHLFILDALYGVLEPGTLIAPYRLDMKAKIGIPLYSYWTVDDVIQDDLIINLASSEFKDMVHLPVVSISFFEKKNNEYVQQATYSKMARGKMLHFMILHKVKTIDEIKQFNEDQYCYNEALSTEAMIVFTR